jgi:hypothetical protein
VQHLFGTAHTGRTKAEEGQEHSRGAIYLEDWADQVWYMTRDGSGVRSLRAMGRDVPQSLEDAFDLSYDGHTRSYLATGQTRTQRRATQGLERVLYALVRGLGISPATALAGLPNTTALKTAMDGSTRDKDQLIQRAVSEGYVERFYSGGEAVDEDADNARKPLFCRPTELGVRYWSMNGDGDGASRRRRGTRMGT